MNKVVPIEWMKGYPSKKLDKWNREIATSIFFHSHLQGQQRDTHVPVMYNYNDISDSFENISIKWFADYDIMEPAFNLYLSSKIGAHKYLTGIFLTLIQGLETLHRRTYNETQMAVGDFDDLYAIIMEVVPLNRKEFVEQNLRYANELSLHKRLKQLILPFEKFYGTSREINSFVRKIVDVRNYLTHNEKKAESRAKKIIRDELFTVCLKLEALFHYISCTSQAWMLIVSSR